MRRLVEWIETIALGMGAPGLFLAAIADSSFLSLPEVVDILLVFMVVQHESRALLYATCATLGSIVGCLLLYGVGRKGDEFIMRRFSAKRVERALNVFRRYGIMAVLIPSLLPPPAPFKIFVLLSGAAGISTPRFVIAVAIGRGIRYFGEAALALWFGDKALDFIRANGRAVSIAIVGLLAAGLVGYLLWNRSRRAAA
jgi:membrane protein YqaA with SNARE-associated domain